MGNALGILAFVVLTAALMLLPAVIIRWLHKPYR